MLIIQQPEGAADPLEGKYLIITDAHTEGALFVWEVDGMAREICERND